MVSDGPGKIHDLRAFLAEVERLTQFATSLGKTLDARIGDVRRRDDEIESLRRDLERLTQENTRMAGEIEVWRVINARALDFANAERDVIEKAKEWRTFAQEPTMHGWSAEEEALIAAVDALGDSQGDTDGQ
jgi:hypothetical protein